MSHRALLFDLDNTLLMEDEATFASVRAACEIARARAGAEPSALFAAVTREAETLWRAAPTYAYCDAMGIWWGEGLWGDFAGEAPELRAVCAFVPGFRHEVWERALAAIGKADPVLADELASAYRVARRSRQIVDVEAEAVLDDLARDHRLGLVTNGAPDVQREKLAGTSLATRFGAVVISAELGIAKPDPRIFRVALDALGVDDAAAMVGDSLTRDVAGARSAGIRSIWIDRTGEPPRPEDPVPDAHVRALSEVRSVLDAPAPAAASPRGSPGPRPA